MKKRGIISLFLAAVMILSVSPMQAIGEDGLPDDNTASDVTESEDSSNNDNQNGSDVAPTALNTGFEEINITNTDSDETSITVSWNAVENAARYEVIRSGAVFSSDITGTSCVISGLSGGEAYYIKVNAYDYEDNSISSSQELTAYTDWVISANTAMNRNRVVSDLNVNAGTLDLNGYTLTVKGDTYLGRNSATAYINVNKGKLYAEGDFRIEGNYNYGRLTMQYAEDYICVYGNFYTNAYYQSTMTNGILEVMGDFTQKYYSGNTNNFLPSGNHTVRLTGTKLQTVSFDRIESGFNTLDIRNFSADGVVFATNVNAVNLITNGCNVTFFEGERSGWNLSGDETFNGDLFLGSGTLDLNGHKLTITGNLIQSGGIVLVNSGELEVQGDYRIQTLRNGAYSNSAGTLNMTDNADTVKVFGDFVTQSSVSHNGLLSAGTLEIGGNLTQLGGANNNFYTSGTHTVVLNGGQKQTVSIANNTQSYSRINNLKITNTSTDGVDFARYVYIVGSLYNTETPVTNGFNIYAPASIVFADNAWNHDIKIVESRTLTDDLTIGGSVWLDSGTLTVNGKRLTVEGNFNCGTASGYSTGFLKMTGSNDYVFVNGDFYSYSYYSSSGYLTAGTIEVRGNFTQRRYSNNQGFYATGTHKVILSGGNLQTVSFDSIESQFNILEIQNESSDGVRLLTPVTIVTLTNNGNNISFSSGERAGWKLESDETVTGDLILGIGTLDLNGHKLTITGNLIQSGGIVLVNGGELEVQGDYRIQTLRNDAYSNSAGTLNMTDNADTVKVFGDFITQSSVSHNGVLTSGTLEIGGDLTQVTGGSTTNFYPTGTHTVILNGSRKQTVSIANNSTSYSRINNLKITNTSTDGVDFARAAYVAGNLYNTDAVIVNGTNICAPTSMVFADNAWNSDIRIVENRTLSEDLTIGGSVWLDSGTLAVNGKRLTVDGNFNCGTASGYSTGFLKMTGSNDYVFVNGDFYSYSYYSSSGYLTAGTIEVRGNFTQRRYSNNQGFYATGTHKVILSGENLQTVSFDSIESQFNILEIQNESADGVKLLTPVTIVTLIDNGNNISFSSGERAGWKLNSDETVAGDIILGIGTLDLNGHKLTITGNLTQSGGIVLVNGGELEIQGDYKIQTVSGGASSGSLNMTKTSDLVNVNGSFVTQSSVSHNGLLTAGTLEIGGNLTQIGGANNNFYTSGTHTVVLNGGQKQTVSIANNTQSYSRINNLKITNTSPDGVDFERYVYVVGSLYNTETPVTNGFNIYVSSSTVFADNAWNRDIRIAENRTLSSDLYIGGSLHLDGGTLNINGKKLTVNGDFNWGLTNSISYGRFQMANSNSYVLVNGDFYCYSGYTSSGYLTAGTLEVKGNFTQKSGNANNFLATGTHKVILSGDKLQYISFESAESQFNILEITKELNLGYRFNRTPVWNELIEITAQGAPSAPANLRFVRSTSSSIMIAWTNTATDRGIESYQIYRDGVLVGQTSNTEYIDNGLQSKTKYTYYVTAKDFNGNVSEQSSSMIASTDVNEYAPAPPVNLSAKIQSANAIALTWTGSPDSARVTRYVIWRNDEQIGYSDGTSYIDNTAIAGYYTYYVEVEDRDGNVSVPSNTVSIDNQPPSKPILSLGTVTETSISLSFESADNIGVVRYQLYKNGVSISNGSNTSYTDSNIEYNKTYVYYVVAYDAQGNASERSDELTVFTGKDTDPPEIISVTSAKTVYSGNAEINVKARDNYALSKIYVQVSSDGNTWADADNANATGRVEETLKISVNTADFADGKLYVRAYAEDKSGNASNPDDSAVYEITADNTAPNAPFNLTSDLSGGRIVIQWDYNKQDTDISYFRVYRKAGSESEYKLIKDNHKNIDLSDNNIEIGLEYTYRVTAVDKAGNESGSSNEVTVSIADDKVKPQILSIAPATGSKIAEKQTISISCYDNIMLSELTVERKDGNVWTGIYSGSLDKYAQVVSLDIDMSGFETGTYQFRAKARDSAGNESDYFTVSYDYRKPTISAPNVTAEGQGWAVALNWAMTDTRELLGYDVYRRTSAARNYSKIASITGTAFTDSKVTAGEKYFYKVEAVDSYGNIVSSTEVSAVPTHEDNIKPVADAGSDLQGIAGKAVSFDGSNSWDNNYIASYLWDFGGGNTSNSAKPTHTYTNEGTYTAALTVTDSAGNSDSHSVKVSVYSADYVKVAVTANVGGVRIYSEDTPKITDVYTNSSGKYDLVIKNGSYDFYFYKSGYLPKMINIDTESLNPDNPAVAVNLTEKELITGTLTSRPLDLNEMLALGIDINDPANQFVYEYSIDFLYKGHDIAFHAKVNLSGEILDGISGINDNKWTITDEYGNKIEIYLDFMTRKDFESITSNSGGGNGNGQKCSVAALFITSATVTWQKEFFDIEMIIINNADENFTIEGGVASLNVPKGLSLAGTARSERENVDITTIRGGEIRSVSWILRGDVRGEYRLTASFSGTLMPLGESVAVTFETDPDNPLKVWGGSALKIEVWHDVWGIYNDYFTSTYTITNISDKPVYNIDIDFICTLIEANCEEDIGELILYGENGYTLIPYKNEKPDLDNIRTYFNVLVYEDPPKDIINLNPEEKLVFSIRIKKQSELDEN